MPLSITCHLKIGHIRFYYLKVFCQVTMFATSKPVFFVNCIFLTSVTHHLVIFFFSRNVFFFFNHTFNQNLTLGSLDFSMRKL